MKSGCMLITKNSLPITSQEKWFNITTKTHRKVELYWTAIASITFSRLLAVVFVQSCANAYDG